MIKKALSWYARQYARAYSALIKAGINPIM